MITKCENTQKILSVLPHNNARIEFMQECGESGLKILEIIQPLYPQVFSRFSFKKLKKMTVDLVQEEKEHHQKYYKNIPFEESDSSTIYLDVLSKK